MASASLDTSPPASGDHEAAGLAASSTHGVAEPEVNWWWEYAAMKAPEHNEMYYFKYTLLSLAYFFAFSLAIHIFASRYTRVYNGMDTTK